MCTYRRADVTHRATVSAYVYSQFSQCSACSLRCFFFFACTHVIESELAAVLRHTKLPLIRGWSSTQRLMIHRSGASPNLVQISSARHLLGLVMKQNHNPSDLGRSIQVGPRRLHSKTRRPRPFPRPGRGLCPTLGWRRSSGP